MKLITRNTDYAIRALVYLAQTKKEIASVEELARELKIPRAFLRRLLQVLGKKGILKSHKGKGGGFILRVAPEKIRIVELIRIFQGKIGIVNCMLKKQVCPNTSSCLFRAKIKEIERNVLTQLESITLASLLKGKAA
jgi:Rrf2 family protein